MSTPAVVLGVDVGTTATKVVAVAASGAIVGGAERGYPTRTTEPGEAVQDPVALREAALDAVTRCAETCAVAGRDVAGLAFSGAVSYTHLTLPTIYSV